MIFGRWPCVGLVVLVILTFAPHLKAESQTKLMVGIVEDTMPCSDLNESDLYEGLSLELWRRVSEVAQTNYDLKAIPTFSQAIRQIADGSLDVLASCPFVTPDRLELVDFSMPYISAKLVLLSRKSRNIPLFSVIRRVLTDKVIVSSVLVLLLITFFATSFIARLENDFAGMVGFHSGKKGNFLRAWIMLTLGCGVNTLLHRNAPAKVTIFFVSIFRILFLSMFVGALLGAVVAGQLPKMVNKLDAKSLEKMLQEGIAVTAGTKDEEWILSEVEEFGLNNLSFMVKSSAGYTNLSAMLARGEVRHIVVDTVALADFRSNLPNPDEYFISYITKFSFPVAFALRPSLADNLKDEIDIAITELYADGSIETLFSPVSRLD